MKIDYTQYIVLVKPNSLVKKENYKLIPLREVTLLFIPESEFKSLDIDDKPLTFNWQVMKPVLTKLLDEDWDYTIENDADEDELNRINQEVDDPFKRLDVIKGYFDQKYRWPDGIPDPMLHTKLLITPPEGDYPVVIYYGEMVSFQNNADANLMRLFETIWNEFIKLKINGRNGE